MTTNKKLIADVTVFSGNKILLVKYKDSNRYDHQKGWFIPDDMIKDFEHPEDAAKRILSEQLNLNITDLSMNHIESFKGNDSSRHLVFHFKTEIKDSMKINPSGELDECKWFESDNLPDKNEVAHHGWALYIINEIKSAK